MNLNLNLKDFLKFLSRYKWWVIIIPVICLIITYFLVDKLPKSYTSEALIATGITSQVQQSSLVKEEQGNWQEIGQQFDNLMEMMKSRRVISNLTYKLILHDLKDPVHSFKEYSEVIKQLTPAQKQETINAFEDRFLNNKLTSVEDNKGKIPLFDIISSMGYDEGSLLKDLNISRSGGSDFIKVEYTGPNPDLTSFVSNSLANDFVFYYTDLTIRGQKQALAVLDTLLQQRQDEVSRKSAQLSSSAAAASASATNALNAQRRADRVLNQSSEAQAQKAQLVRNIASLQASIAEIDAKLRGSGGYLNNNIVRENSEITNIDNQLAAANRRYVNNDFNARDRATIDSLNNIKTRLITQSAGSVGANQAVIKQDLIGQKMKLENDLASARSALVTVESQISAIGGAPTNISALPAGVDGAQQMLLQDAQTSAQQYAQVQAQYDQIMLSAKAGTKLSVAESALPGAPNKSKNILYLGLSYISSLLICLLALFTIFATNNSINTAEQLKNATNQKVIGSLNKITEGDKDLRNIWKNDGSIRNYTVYKDLLRSLRFELDRELKDNNKILGITSLYDSDGKSFLSGSLAYAFAMMGKNVLLICDKEANLIDLLTNRENEEENSQVFESFIVKKQIQIEDRITILNRNKNNRSLLELRDNNSLYSGFQLLKETFDLIIIDIDSSQEIHNAKEWLMFSDKSISVFKAGNKITDNNKEFLKFLSDQKGFLGWVLNNVPVENS